MTVRVPIQLCPGCGATLDAASHLSEKGVRPDPGSVTICLYCQLPLIFGRDLRLERLDMEAFAKEDRESHDELVQLIALTRRFKRKMQRDGEWPAEKGGPDN